jgi:TrfA protein
MEGVEKVQNNDPQLDRVNPEAAAALRRMQDLRAARVKAEQPETAPAAKLIQLPLWPDSRQGIPNAIVRSALFPTLNSQEGRPFLKDQIIASVRGITMNFTGEQFDQSDLDVYLELLDLVAAYPLGTQCGFSAYGMLKRLHRQTGNSDHKWLHSVLIRLCGGVTDITDHKKRYFGQLLHGGIKDELTKHYRVAINPQFAALFGYGMWSTIDRQQRRQLGRNWTAKALHAYYSTHVSPSSHRFETLASIIGLHDKKKRQLRTRIIGAHERMKEIGFLRGYKANDTAIKALIRPNHSQARHLGKKIIANKSVTTLSNDGCAQLI